MDQRPIGIFDSGVGGLTVVGEIMKSLPNEELIYFGDTARVPYGSKSAETVTKFSRQIFHFLLSKDVKAIVIACSTASSNSFDALTAEFNIPILEVLSPGVEDCAHVTRNKIIGVIGTEATIRSGKYNQLLQEKIPDVTVYSKA
ncbi:MAG: glutamate racemase, partial [Clostridiales bacterium]|nr:glutamate racemase [Clostridiales bacterium]